MCSSFRTPLGRRATISEQELDSIAEMMVQNSNLRAGYFAKSGKILARFIPLQGPTGRLLLRGEAEKRALKAKLTAKDEDKISQNGRMLSLREAYMEQEAFLRAKHREISKRHLTLFSE